MSATPADPAKAPRRRLTALDRASQDLDAAVKREARTKDQARKTRTAWDKARAEHDIAEREVSAFRRLVDDLAPKTPTTGTTTDKETS